MQKWILLLPLCNNIIANAIAKCVRAWFNNLQATAQIQNLLWLLLAKVYWKIGNR